jgi:hypothetical protein
VTFAFLLLGCLVRTTEKYMTARAASDTPLNIKIEVVTILLACFYYEEEPGRRFSG